MVTSLHVPQLPDVEWRWTDGRITPALIARITASDVDDSVELVCSLICMGVARFVDGRPEIDVDVWINGELKKRWQPNETFAAFLRDHDEDRATQILQVCDRHQTNPTIDWPCVRGNSVLREAMWPG